MNIRCASQPLKSCSPRPLQKGQCKHSGAAGVSVQAGDHSVPHGSPSRRGRSSLGARDGAVEPPFRIPHKLPRAPLPPVRMYMRSEGAERVRVGAGGGRAGHVLGAGASDPRQNARRSPTAVGCPSTAVRYRQLVRFADGTLFGVRPEGLGPWRSTRRPTPKTNGGRGRDAIFQRPNARDVGVPGPPSDPNPQFRRQCPPPVGAQKDVGEHIGLDHPPPPAADALEGEEASPPIPPPGPPAYAQPLSPSRQMPAARAFVTDSNRPQPLWQPPPTACLTAAGAASEVPSLLMRPPPPLREAVGSS